MGGGWLKGRCGGWFGKVARGGGGVGGVVGGGRVGGGVIVIEKGAAFARGPGTDARRPQQAPGGGGIEGLYLAGDYTKTEWPATMEGAVRGGYLAAEGVLGVLRELGTGGPV